jgi:hypothetical protein
MAGYISILVIATQFNVQICTHKKTTNNYNNFHYASPQLSKCVRAEFSLKLLDAICTAIRPGDYWIHTSKHL